MGDVVYVGACNGIFYALDAASGDVRWTYDTTRDGPPGQFHGDALVTDELVVVGSDQAGLGYLYAFDRETGAVRWKHGFPRGVGSQIRRDGDAVFAATAAGEVAAVGLDRGELRWSVGVVDDTTADTRSLDPILVGDRFFVGWRSGRVDAYDVDTGERMWRRDLEAPIGTSLAKSPSGIVVGTADGTLTELSLDGEVVGSLSLGTRLYGDLLVAEDCLLALGWSAEDGHFVSCVAPSLEDVRWTHPGPEEWSTMRPWVEDDRVLLGVGGTLFSLSTADGSVEGSCPVDGTPRGLAVSDDVLYLGTVQGRLFVFPVRRCAEERAFPEG